MKRCGFTLIELLVFVAIFSVVVMGFIAIFVTITRVQSRQSSATEVGQQAQFLLQQIQYYVQSARLIDMPLDAAQAKLTLRESVASSSFDPTYITLASGTAYLQQGVGGALQALTSNKVTVSNLSFIRHYSLNGSSSAYGTDSVSYSFTIAANNSNATQFYSQSFESSAAVFAPVPKIALVQQASSATSASNVTSVTSTYPTGNETGDLLVAVISNTGTSTATTSVSDSGGSTWTEIANPKYAVYNQETSIYDTPNYNFTPSGLVGWWKFNDGGGSTAADSSGNGNTGTLEDSPTWAAGLNNNGALQFNGTNQYVDVSETSSLDLAGSWTISAWVNLSALPASSGGDDVFVSKLGNGTTTPKLNYYLALDNNGWNPGEGLNWLVVSQNSGGGVTSANYATSSVSAGTWYYLAGVYSSSTNALYLYLNGSLVATKNFITGVPAGTAGCDLHIGDEWSCASSGGYVDGVISDVRIYNVALSAAQISSIYANPGITVTATFGTGVTNPSLFLYEYRGAAASSFDASSTQTQSSTANPSSGAANPTSTTELIFGSLYSNPSTEVPASGSGFTTETTSSVSATYVEDQDLYVTGPVSANWSYSQTTPSSSATVVTFK